MCSNLLMFLSFFQCVIGQDKSREMNAAAFGNKFKIEKFYKHIRFAFFKELQPRVAIEIAEFQEIHKVLLKNGPIER